MGMPTNFTITTFNEKGEPSLFYAPNSEGQVAYHASTKPNCIMYGNRGGGKSHCGRNDAHVRALSHPGFRYVILRRTYPELQKTHLIHMDREMKLLGGYFNKSEKIAYYPNGSQGFFAYCEGDEDVLKLLSAEFDLMFFDELSTFPWDMFTKLATSCRVKKDSGLIAMVRGGTNPLGVSAQEIMHYFVDQDVDPEEDEDYDPDNWEAIKVQAEDNTNLDVSQYQKRFSGMSAHVRRAWVDGEFSMEDALFDVQPTRRLHNEAGELVETIPYHYIDYLDVDLLVQKAQIYRAYDHGYSPDPAVCLWIAHLGKRYVVFHEKLWYKTVVEDIAAEMKAIDRELGIKRVVTTFADPTIGFNTGADIHTIADKFEMNGVPIDLSVNSRELYASSIHSALATEVDVHVPKLQIWKKGCPYLVKTLPKQQYDPKHPLRMANTKTDHAAIALAYFLISTDSLDRNAGETQRVARPWMKVEKRDWILGTEGVRGPRP